MTQQSLQGLTGNDSVTQEAAESSIRMWCKDEPGVYEGKENDLTEGKSERKSWRQMEEVETKMK